MGAGGTNHSTTGICRATTNAQSLRQRCTYRASSLQLRGAGGSVGGSSSEAWGFVSTSCVSCATHFFFAVPQPVRASPMEEQVRVVHGHENQCKRKHTRLDQSCDVLHSAVRPCAEPQAGGPSAPSSSCGRRCAGAAKRGASSRAAGSMARTSTRRTGSQTRSQAA